MTDTPYTNSPADTEPSQHTPEIESRAIAVLCAALLMFFLSMLLMVMGFGAWLRSGEIALLTIAGVLFAAAAGLCVWRSVRAMRQRRRGAAALWLAIIPLSPFLVWWQPTLEGRPADMMECEATMRVICANIRDTLRRNEPLPPSLALLMIEQLPSYDGSLWKNPSCSTCGPESVRIGDYTLADWIDERVDFETLHASAAEAPDEGLWRSIGHLHFYVERVPILREDPDRITGFADLPGARRGSVVLLHFADGGTITTSHSMLTNEIARHTARYGDDLPPELHALAATPPRRRR